MHVRASLSLSAHARGLHVRSGQRRGPKIMSVPSKDDMVLAVMLGVGADGVQGWDWGAWQQ